MVCTHRRVYTYIILSCLLARVYASWKTGIRVMLFEASSLLIGSTIAHHGDTVPSKLWLGRSECDMPLGQCGRGRVEDVELWLERDQNIDLRLALYLIDLHISVKRRPAGFYCCVEGVKGVLTVELCYNWYTCLRASYRRKFRT